MGAWFCWSHPWQLRTGSRETLGDLSCLPQAGVGYCLIWSIARPFPRHRWRGWFCCFIANEPLASIGYILHHTSSSGMTCWVQWVVLSLAPFSPTLELEFFPVGAISERLVSSLPSRIACGVELPAAEVKIPSLARFTFFRCICNLLYFCKTWIYMSTIVVCVPWLVLDRGLMHIKLRNSGILFGNFWAWQVGIRARLTVGQANWKT